MNNKKTVISATDNTIHKLKALAEEKEGIKGKLVVTAEKLGPKAKEIAVTDKGNDLYKNKKTVISAADNVILELKIKAEDLATVAKEKEDVRQKLVETDKKLVATAKEKEDIRRKLAVTAKELKLKAKKLAVTAEEKEDVRERLAVTAKQLAVSAEEKENIRLKLEVTARDLAMTAKEKESVRRKLEITAEELRLKAKSLATTAKEKEDIRLILEDTAKELKAKNEGLATKLALMVEGTSDYASVADLKGKLLYLNDSGRKMIGLDKDVDIEKLKIADMHPAWASKIILEEGLPYAEQHGNWTGETALLHRDGHEIPVSQVIVVHKDKDGKIDLTATLMRDITERKKAENILKENEERYRTLINVVPLCIKWFDEKGNLISVNQHGKEEHFLVGKSDEEIRNWKYMECIEEKYRDMVKAKMADALEGKSSEFDMEHVPGTSTGHWCHSYLVPAADDRGKVIYVLFISRDFTAEKAVEETKNKNLEMLEKFKELTVDRELRMIDLKKEIEGLKQKEGSGNE